MLRFSASFVILLTFPLFTISVILYDKLDVGCSFLLPVGLPSHFQKSLCVGIHCRIILAFSVNLLKLFIKDCSILSVWLEVRACKAESV